MSLLDLERFRMVAKVMLQQQGDDIEEGSHKHIVPYVQSIDINPKNPQLAVVANYQSIYFVDATSSDLQDRIVYQYSVPQDYFIKQAIFCPMVQYRFGTRIGWKPDIIVSIRYEGQRFIHIMDAQNGAIIKVVLPFVPLDIVAPTSIARDVQSVLPQPLLVLGAYEFSVVAIHDYFALTGYDSLSARTNTYRLPVFASAGDPIQGSFGEDPSVIYIQNGNYFYRYYLSVMPTPNEHALDGYVFYAHFARIRYYDPLLAELCGELLKTERAFARPGKCYLKSIYKLKMDPVLQFKFSHNFHLCAFLTERNVQIFRMADGKLMNNLCVCYAFGVLEDDLYFIPHIQQVAGDLPAHLDEDFDIFADTPSADCSVISDDLEVSSGYEFKYLLDYMDERNEIKGWFDYYLANSYIINKYAKEQQLVNVLKQHPHLYPKFKQMYKQNITQKQNLQRTIENFGYQLIFTEDDMGIIVRPNVFSGFAVFELNERLQSNVRIWQPVNMTSVQDFQSKHCAIFVSGQNIFLLGIGNALYFSAIY